MRCNKRPHHRRAFTAIEMVCVLALMAVIAAGAFLSLAQLQLHSGMAAVIDRLQYFDSLTRRQAEQSGRPLKLVFDDAAVRRIAVDSSPDDSPLPVMRLPEGFTIDEVKIAAADQSAVPISPAGLSPTYALLLERRGQRRWVIVSTVGQPLVAADDGTVEYEIDQLAHP